MNFIEGVEAARHGANTIGVRPEHLSVVAEGGWEGVVGISEHLGSDTFLKIETASAGTLTVRASGDLAVGHGDRVRVAPRPDSIYKFNDLGKAIA